MDSVTQIVLGASVGEAALGKKLGNRAMLWGAVAGTIPDLDVLFNFTHDFVAATELHRGFSHSILFSLIVAPMLGLLISWIHKRSGVTWKEGAWLAFLGLVTHPLLDNFTTWGTELFWPFSDYRIAFKSVFVVDVFYTIPFALLLIWAMFKRKESPGRRRLNRWALYISSFYLLLGVINKQIANRQFEAAFAENGLKVERYMSRATPMNPVLWGVNAETSDAFYIGYYSLFDADDRKIEFERFSKNHEAIAHLRGDEQLETLLKLTNGYWTVTPSEKGFDIADLRFGQNTVRIKENGKFVFIYKVVIGANKKMTFNRGETDISNMGEMLDEIIERAGGN